MKQINDNGITVININDNNVNSNKDSIHNSMNNIVSSAWHRNNNNNNNTNKNNNNSNQEMNHHDCGQR